MQSPKRFGRRVPMHSTRQIRHQLIMMLQEEVRQADLKEAAVRAEEHPGAKRGGLDSDRRRGPLP